VKEFLSRAGVPFLERNVDDDERAYDELLAGGWRSVPMTVLGNLAVRGFDPVRLGEIAQRAVSGTGDEPEDER